MTNLHDVELTEPVSPTRTNQGIVFGLMAVKAFNELFTFRWIVDLITREVEQFPPESVPSLVVFTNQLHQKIANWLGGFFNVLLLTNYRDTPAIAATNEGT